MGIKKVGPFIFRSGEERREAKQLAKEESEADVSRMMMAKSEAREAAREERGKQMVMNAVERERVRGKRRRASMVSGGFFGQMERSARYISGEQPRRKKRKRKTVKRRKTRSVSRIPRGDFF